MDSRAQAREQLPVQGEGPSVAALTVFAGRENLELDCRTRTGLPILLDHS